MTLLSLEEFKPALAHFAERAAAPSDGAEWLRELQTDVVIGVALSISLDMIDANWRAAFLEGREGYDPAQERVIEGYFREWLRVADGVLKRIDAAEAGGHQLTWSDPFRRAHREARAVFAADADYFAGSALTDLRDDAVDAHRAGRAADFHELGD